MIELLPHFSVMVGAGLMQKPLLSHQLHDHHICDRGDGGGKRSAGLEEEGAAGGGEEQQ